MRVLLPVLEYIARLALQKLADPLEIDDYTLMLQKFPAKRAK